jgi:anaerobic ribonucleoside-triphosphate reductase
MIREKVASMAIQYNRSESTLGTRKTSIREELASMVREYIGYRYTKYKTDGIREKVSSQ